MECCHPTPCDFLHRGPFSDRYGHRLTYNLSTLMFLGTTLGCAFSPNINALILMRALQGFAREQQPLWQPAGAPAACVTASMHAWREWHHARHHAPATQQAADVMCAGPAAVLLLLVECSVLTTGQAVIADVFQPAIRGAALGLFMQAVVSEPAHSAWG